MGSDSFALLERMLQSLSVTSMGSGDKFISVLDSIVGGGKACLAMGRTGCDCELEKLKDISEPGDRRRLD